jgi:hypothetical protein
MLTVLAQAPVPAHPAPAHTAAIPASTGVRHIGPEVYHAAPQNWSVVEDNRGILYFGNTSGVLEFDGVHWRLIKLPNQSPAFALSKAADGRILVGGDGEAGWLAPDAAGTMVYVSQSAELPETFRKAGENVVQILDSPAGVVWLSDHFLFVKKKGGEVTSLTSSDHFMNSAWFNNALYVLDSGRGLLRLEGETLAPVPGGAHLSGLTMAVTSAGLVIPSFSDGLVRYAPESANPWQKIQAAGWNEADGVDVTSSIAVTPDLLVLGLAHNGVALLDVRSGVLQRIGTDQGLTDAHIDQLAYNKDGGLWLALQNGVSLVGLNLPRDPDALPFQSWVRSVVATRNERLIFGGAFYEGQGAVQQLHQGLGQIPVFPFQENAFRFEYSANGLTAKGDMQFQTYLQGIDPDWSPWTDRSEREFTGVGAGNWTFKVRARKANGEIASEGTYQFTIKPLWYNTWWFTIFEVLFVMGLVLLPGHTPHPRLQNILTLFGVTVVFVYVGNWVSDMVSHYYSSDISIVGVVISALLALGLAPVQNGFQALVEKRNKKRREVAERRREENHIKREERLRRKEERLKKKEERLAAREEDLKGEEEQLKQDEQLHGRGEVEIVREEELKRDEQELAEEETELKEEEKELEQDREEAKEEEELDRQEGEGQSSREGE